MWIAKAEFHGQRAEPLNRAEAASFRAPSVWSSWPFGEVLEPMARSPGSKCGLQRQNSMGNVLSTSTDLNRPTSVPTGLLQRALLGRL